MNLSLTLKARGEGKEGESRQGEEARSSPFHSYFSSVLTLGAEEDVLLGRFWKCAETYAES